MMILDLGRVTARVVNRRAKLVVQIDKARNTCLAELPEVLKLRKEAKTGKDKLMRFAEIEKIARIFKICLIHSLEHQGARVYTYKQ